MKRLYYRTSIAFNCWLIKRLRLAGFVRPYKRRRI